jgi:AraC family transcriptional regulator
MTKHRNDGRFFGSLVQTASLAGLRISHGVYQPHARLPRHSHAQPYLCLVAAGTFEERACRRTATCSTGAVVWNPGEEHEDKFGRVGARTWNLDFTDSWNDRVEQATPDWTPVQSAEVTWLVTGILRELAVPDNASALSFEGLVCALIGAVSRRRVATDRRRPAWVSLAHDRLRAEYRKPPSVGELAQSAGVHRSHFSRSFRRFSGCTVAEFVRRLRVDWASEQLRHQECTLSELSFRAGFSDQAHFTRAFKRMTGLTPGEYRASMQ